jgi:hypothetical protein
MPSANPWAAGMSVSQGGLIAGTPPDGINTILRPTIMAIDATGAWVTREFELRLRPSSPLTLTFQTASLPNAQVGEYFDVGITVEGGIYPLTFTSVGNLPPGITLTNDNVHGILRGPATAAGNYNLTIRVEDATGISATKQYTLLVLPAPLRIGAAVLPQATERVFFTHQFQAINGTAPYTFNVSTGLLPPGLSLSSSGLLSGTPSTVAQASFTITVTDSLGAQASSSFFVVVAGMALEIGPDTLPDAVLGRQYFAQLTVLNATPPYGFFQVAPLAGQLGVFNTNQDGLVSLMPEGEPGVRPLSVRVIDWVGRQGTRTFDVNVGQSYVPPLMPSAVFRDSFGGIRLTSYPSSAPQSSGGVFASNPGLAQNAGGDSFVVARDNFNGLWLNSFQSQTWTGWFFAGGTVQGEPAIAAIGASAYFMARDNYNAYWIRRYTPGAGFGNWINLGGVFATDPVIAASGTCCDYYIAGRDNSGAIWIGTFNGNTDTFSGFVNGGAVAVGKPSLTKGADGAAYVAIRDTSNAVWMGRFSSIWDAWQPAGGVIASDPRTATVGTNIRLVALTNTGAVWNNRFVQGVGNNWQGWTTPGGVLTDVAIAAGSSPHFYLVGRDTGNSSWWYNSNEGWSYLGNQGLATGPFAAAPR